MKYVYITLLFISIAQSVDGQCISIELSITWERKDSIDIFSQDEKCTPFLNILYRNNSNIPLYVKNSHQNRSSFPSIVEGGLFEKIDSLSTILLLRDTHSADSYIVDLSSFSDYSNYWELLRDTVSIENEHEIDPINDELSGIYAIASIRPQSDFYDSVSQRGRNQLITKSFPVNSDNKVNKQLVFLKPGGIYVEKYNLFAFQFLKGEYTFVINKDTLKSCVLMDQVWDENSSNDVESTVIHPTVIDRYVRYSDKLMTNQVSIKF